MMPTDATSKTWALMGTNMNIECDKPPQILPFDLVWRRLSSRRYGNESESFCRKAC